MAVVGIDFGNDNCYISVARQGGIETIANDYSLRETPSFVGFSDRQRILGVSAKNQCLTNVRRTIFWFKHLIGRKFKDPRVQDFLNTVPYKVTESPSGGILIHVKEQTFSPEQITAMLFSKLKETAEDALQTKVKDVVISCPCYFTDRERRALLNAAAIADLNVLKLINDTTATALAYGIYKQDLPPPDQKARNVIFVDCGHMGIQVSAGSFHKGKLVMKACTFDRNLGGQAFDHVLARFFADEFKRQHNLNPCSCDRAYLKLMLEVEKIKKQMSANTNALPLNIECLMEEKDLNGRIDRATFEEYAKPYFDRLNSVLNRCLAMSEWKLEDIHSVEVVGGSTRAPAIKMAVEKVFGKPASTTLNSDEAVSRGCALQCAMLSPTFKVREFSVTDIQPFSIKLSWETDNKQAEMVVFQKFHQIPFSKMLTFYRKENFSLKAFYEDGTSEDPPTDDVNIGSFEVGEVPPGGENKIKVKVRINLHGVFTVSSASLIEKVDVMEEVPMEVDEAASAAAQDDNPPEVAPNNDESMATAANKDNQEKPPQRMEKRIKTVTKTIDLPISSMVTGSMARDTLERLTDQERSMCKQDKTENERLTAKNSVEEYIYEIREKIQNCLADFILDEDKATYTTQLEQVENWLYEDGEDLNKEAYLDKLKQLKVVGDAAKSRMSEFESRQKAIDSLGHALQMATKILDQYRAGDEQYDHLDPDGVEKVAKLINEKSHWMNKAIATLDKTDKTANPTILVSQFYCERDDFDDISRPILTKLKPKVEPPAAKEKKNNDETANPPTMDTTGPEETPKGGQAPSMDVD